MNRRFLILGLVVVGFCLLGLGLAWDRLVSPKAYWTPAQAEEYAAAQLEMHAKSHQHSSEAEKEMALARERFEKISRQLERARSSRKWTGRLFLAAGIISLAAGIVLHAAVSRSE
jgi:hypothetical protein